MGPVVSQRQRDRVLSYLDSGRAEGARVATSRKLDDLPAHGWFVPPTVFADVTNDMKDAREEIFGPVSRHRYDTIDDAVPMANDNDYGLSGRCSPPTSTPARNRRPHPDRPRHQHVRKPTSAPFAASRPPARPGDGSAGLDEYIRVPVDIAARELKAGQSPSEGEICHGVNRRTGSADHPAPVEVRTVARACAGPRRG